MNVRCEVRIFLWPIPGAEIGEREPLACGGLGHQGQMSLGRGGIGQAKAESVCEGRIQAGLGSRGLFYPLVVLWTELCPLQIHVLKS